MSSLVCRILDRSQWHLYDRFVDDCAWGNVLQTSSWGLLKSETGWEPSVAAVTRDDEIAAGALVLAREIPGLGVPILYSPRGPVVEPDDGDALKALVDAVTSWAGQRRAVMWKVDPSWSVGMSAGDDGLRAAGFRHLDTGDDFDGIQPRFVMPLFLQGRDADEILSDMHQKTRYNIRLAQRRGVGVSCAEDAGDMDAFYRILKITSRRDRFGIRDISYFRHLWSRVLEPGWGRLFLAHYEGELLAATIGLIGSGKVWYLYGASGNEHRNVMPNYALQWAMIRWAMDEGCSVYDFRAVSGDLSPDNPLYGLYRFKKGFGAELVELVGEYDLVFRPVAYRLWRAGEPVYRALRDALSEIGEGLR